jgi:hypothetical protein
MSKMNNVFSIVRTSLEICAAISRLSNLGITDSLYCIIQRTLIFQMAVDFSLLHRFVLPSVTGKTFTVLDYE